MKLNQTQKFTPINFDNYMKEAVKVPGYAEAHKALDSDSDIILMEALAVAHQKGMTQKDIASKMGTTQSAISKAFSASGNPTLKFLRRFAKALDMNLSIQFQA